ncbi:MAG: YggT family protein [Actinomycetota bacterium]|nr:YggT family protein [Actinomycetota bacterium]MDQ1499703.1 YggT family protein [Actinomycetota bacterium]MDQ1502741.1 YggT family protein [Actinomycetota bacterium]
MRVLCQLLNLYFIILFARVILSWFPLQPGTALASIASIIYQITEPVMGPVRRIIPTVGMIDISPIVVFFGLRIIQGAIGC